VPRAIGVGLALVLGLGGCGGSSAASGRDGGEQRPTTTTATTSGDRAGTSVATAPPPTAPPEVELTLAFGGDLLPHLPLVRVAQQHGAATGVPYDFGPLLAPLAPVVSGVDLALCHLEVPLVADGQQVTGYPSFHAPRELAGAVAGAGYDGCSTASNHSLDGGLPGIIATLDTFDVLGLGHTGTARNAAEAATPRTYEVRGARIAHLSYTYGFNGYALPEGAPWAANGLDPARVATDAAAARAAGAQLVVVSVHWGSEYRAEPDPLQQELAPVLDAIGDVDLVIGHHAHVVQPVERVGDTWVVYGLGNQLSNQGEPERRDGLTVVVTVGGPPGGRLAVRRLEAVPTWVDLATHQVLPVGPTLARPDLDPGLRADLEGSRARTMEVVNRRGAGLAVRP